MARMARISWTADVPAGDAVAVVDPGGHEVARGLSTMSSRDLRSVRGLRTEESRRVSPHLEDEDVAHEHIRTTQALLLT